MREPDYYAVHSKPGVHIGLWKDKAWADEALREYEGGTLTPLYTADQTWQPIETAPRDGSIFLASTIDAQKPSASMCKFCDVKFLTLSKGEKFEAHGWSQWWPTHWMPLPATPSKGGGSEEKAGI